MKYKEFTKDKIKVSRLGFGLMRLPTIDGDNAKIDYKASRKLVEKALETGINYFDTAYNYHSQQSEIFTGEIFSGGLREKIHIATKNPVWLIEKPEDFERLLDIQLKKLQTNYIDFYLLHSMNKDSLKRVMDNDVYRSALKAKEDGKIKYFGFSFHDDIKTFKEIVDSFPFDFVQIQLNYLDENYQAGLEGMRYAKSKGMSVVVMEPLRGGQLSNLPESMSKNLGGRTPSELALSYLFNMEEVDIVLSGMNDIGHIEENTRVAGSISPNSMDGATEELINYLSKEIESRIQVDCTRCNYCMPCPTGVKIPSVFKLYNNMYIFEEEAKSKKGYEDLIKDNGDQSHCVECGQCETLCPQHLPIIEDLKRAHKELA